MAVMLLFSSYYFRFNLKSIRKKSNIEAKLNLYRSAVIVRYALLEGPGLLAIVSYLLTANTTYILLALVVIAYLYVVLPTKGKVILDLEIDQSEQ